MTNGTQGKRAAELVARHQAGFTLSCPSCGENEVAITLDLGDLVTCICGSCEDSFAVSTAVSQLSERLAQWQAVQRWIDLAGEILAPPATPE